MSTTWNWKNWKSSQETEDWKAARKEQLTASVIPEFFGLGYRPWKDLYKDAPEKEENEHMIRGKECEPEAAAKFASDYQARTVGEILALCQPGLLIREETLDGHTIVLGASIDRLIMRYSFGSQGQFKLVEWINLEIKVPNKFHGLPQSKADIKPRYIIQVLIQMFVAKLERSFLMFWKEDSNTIFEIKYNKAADAVLGFILPLIPKMEDFYFNGSDPRPRTNPFKIHSNKLCKLLEDVQVELCSF